MTRTQRNAEPLHLDGGGLGKLSFEWLGDRYQHAWLQGDEALLRSSDQAVPVTWPDSPPLQQIHQQSFADGREVIFGVGMAGRGHWSASFTLVPDLRCWIVELACRSSSRPESLASSYKLNNLWQPCDNSVFWQCQTASVLFQLEPIQTNTRVQINEKNLAFMPLEISTQTPSTTQWAFRLRIM